MLSGGAIIDIGVAAVSTGGGVETRIGYGTGISMRIGLRRLGGGR